MGDHPLHGPSPGGVPLPGGAAADGATTAAKTDGKWEYTSAATAREEAGFQILEEYIQRRQNMVAQYNTIQSLLDLCEGAEWALRLRVGMWWWDQAGINMAGAREAESAEEEGVEECPPSL